jgi:hypothetical protein
MTEITTQPVTPQTPAPQPKPRKHWIRDTLALGVALAAGLLIGNAVGSTGRHTTDYVYKDVATPGSGQTTTITVAPPAPAPGTQVGTWSGSGNENTPAFNVPASGDYVVSWTYSGNNNGFDSSGANFIIEITNSGVLSAGLPNDIAVSGSGSTEITGDSGTESFNVQATGSWTITVVTAS